jgi:hypothetical protein
MRKKQRCGNYIVVDIFGLAGVVASYFYPLVGAAIIALSVVWWLRRNVYKLRKGPDHD